MNQLSKLFLATVKAASVAWREGKYTFLVSIRSAQKHQSESEMWLKAFDDLDRKEKENTNGTQK